MTTRLVSCCDNLNQQSSLSVSQFGEDTTTTITVGGLATNLLSANTARRLVKIFLVSQSVLNAEVWIRYGVGATLINSAHPLLLKHLLIIDSAQASNAISAICSTGTAQLRVSSANAL
jgi:hypothetical protein